MGQNVFRQLLLVGCVYLAPVVASVAEPLDPSQLYFGYEQKPEPPFYVPEFDSLYGSLYNSHSSKDTDLKNKINQRLLKEGLSEDIDIVFVKSAAFRLTFGFQYKDRDVGFRQLSAFRGSQSTTLWIKVFMAISDIAHISLTLIEGSSVGTILDCGLNVTMKTGRLEAAKSTRCEAPQQNAALPRSIDIPLSINRADIASAAEISVASAAALDQVRDVAKDFFKNYGVEATIAETDKSYFVIGAYALRNAVLVGENRWEKVSLYISNVSQPQGFGWLTLFVVTDGFYTAGLNKPPEASYTTPFEPAHYKQLEDFTNRFGQFVREKMSGRK